MTNVREIAFEALLLIDKDEYSNTFVSELLDKYSYLDKQDRSFIKRLIEGVVERRITIDYVINSFSKVSVNKMKPAVRTLIRMGVYQIMYMDAVPVSAAVNESVKLAKKRGFSSLSGFINGVLRNVSRNLDNVKYPDEKNNPVQSLSVEYSCPEWIVNLLISEQGYDNTKALLTKSVEASSLYARVNMTKTTPEALIDKLSSCGIKADASGVLPYAVCLHNIDKITELPGFSEGEFAIQDISSMLVCHIAQITDTDTVIDVCASPGGKSMHAADIASKGKVIACDVSEDKLVRIHENMTRCGFDNVSVRCLDATDYNDELTEAADVIIADVPCSGLGVIGRKNDIKYRISQEGMDELVKLQRKILDNVVKYLKKGGTFMYSTCTVHRAENEDNVAYLRELGLRSVDISERLPRCFASDTAKDGYVQLYGEDGLSDGFFIAKFIKE